MRRHVDPAHALPDEEGKDHDEPRGFETIGRGAAISVKEHGEPFVHEATPRSLPIPSIHG